jgi:hypothetical protein
VAGINHNPALRIIGGQEPVTLAVPSRIRFWKSVSSINLKEFSLSLRQVCARCSRWYCRSPPQLFTPMAAASPAANGSSETEKNEKSDSRYLALDPLSIRFTQKVLRETQRGIARSLIRCCVVGVSKPPRSSVVDDLCVKPSWHFATVLSALLALHRPFPLLTCNPANV